MFINGVDAAHSGLGVNFPCRILPANVRVINASCAILG